MVWKRSTNTGSVGTAARFGAADINKYSDYLDNVNVADPVTIATDTTFNSGKLTAISPVLTTSNLSAPTIADATDITISNTTGSKIGQSNSKIGFFGATPIVQPAVNVDTSGAVLADLETEVNQIKQLLRDLGLMAT